MTFQIGDRVKCVKWKGARFERGKIYTIDGDDFATVMSDGYLRSRFELYAKAGEFVKGDVVMPANVVGGPWTVLDVQARDDGQRICFPGEYGQWWRADAYRLATEDEINAAADVVAAEFANPKNFDKPLRPIAETVMAYGANGQDYAISHRREGDEIPAADFDFDQIKAGDEITVRLRVHSAGLDNDGDVVCCGRTEEPLSLRYTDPSEIISVIPAPEPKTLRERAIEAVFESVPGIVTADPDKGVVLAGGQVISLHALVDLVLAEVEKGR